jgi:hypothetical protein
MRVVSFKALIGIAYAPFLLLCAHFIPPLLTLRNSKKHLVSPLWRLSPPCTADPALLLDGRNVALPVVMLDK